MKEYRRRYREKHGLPAPKSRSWKKIGGAVVALCILGFGGFFAAQTRAEQMVTLDGHSVQDMTEEDIANYLDLHAKDIEGRKLHLAADGVDTTLSLDELGAKLDRDYIDDELHLIGRQGMPWERVADVATTLMHGKDIPLAIAVDEEKLDKALTDLHDKHDKDPENAFAYVKEDNKTVAVEPEKDRIVINTAGLKDSITDSLHKGQTGDIDVPIDSRQQADVKSGDLKDIDTVLSYYTTHFDNSNPDRNTNIKLAQERLNHAFVASQQDFSFNKYVGTRTADKGYKQAPSYFENRLEQSVGGGVCQVSTTLFNAASGPASSSPVGNRISLRQPMSLSAWMPPLPMTALISPLPTPSSTPSPSIPLSGPIR